MQIATVGLDIAKNVFQVHGTSWHTLLQTTRLTEMSSERYGTQSKKRGELNSALAP
jgi:hypothetical protein